MATIQQSMRLYDGVTGPLKQIQQAMSLTLNVFEKMQDSISERVAVDFGTKEIELARSAVNRLGAEMVEIQEEQLKMIDNQNKFNRSASSGRGFMSGLGGTVIAVNQGVQLVASTMRGISTLMTQADARNSADARLNLINDGLRTQVELEQQVMAAANNSRASYESTANLVAKVGRQDYFKGNNGAAVAFAETLNKGFVVSGASAVEMENALTQLSQGLSAGVLRGEEFNSMSEQAPYLMEKMAASLGVTKGELRGMAEEGMLTTQVVVDSIMQQSEAIDQEFGKMPMTFGQNMTILKNYWSQMLDTLSQPGQGIDKILQQVQSLVAWLNTSDGNAFMNGLTAGVNGLLSGFVWLGNIVADVYNFFASNWAWIAPILFVIVGVLSGLTAGMLAYKAAVVTTSVIEGIRIAKQGIMTAVTLAQSLATGTATATQLSLNGAMYACPLVWLIGLIIAVIVVIGLLSAWIIKQCKTNDTWANNVATVIGAIIGFFYGLWAYVQNIFIAMWNIVGPFVAFFKNAFTDPVAAVKLLFLDLATSVIGYFQKIAGAIESAINLIPGVEVDMTSGLDNTLAKIDEMRSEIEKGAGVESFKQMEYVDIADNFSKGFDKGFGSSMDYFSKDTSGADDKMSAVDDFLGTYNEGETTIATVGGIEDTVDVSSEDLEIMRELAEMESIQNFVTLTPQVSVVTGPVGKEADIDELVRRIEGSMENEIAASTKGVYDVG